MDTVSRTLPVSSTPRSGVLPDLPGELKSTDHWALFRLTRDRATGRFKKFPLSGFKSNDASTWKSFEQIAPQLGSLVRPAFALSADRLSGPGLIVIDVDHCVTDGQLSPAAARILQMFAGTYIERSVSGDGFHIFLYGTTTMRPHEKLIVDGTDLDIEVYSSRRFIVMTGELAEGGAPVILDLQPQLDLLASMRPGFTPVLTSQPVPTSQPVITAPAAVPAVLTPSPILAAPAAPTAAEDVSEPDAAGSDPDRDLRQLRAALEFLSPDHYTDWFCHGIALKRWGLEHGREEDAYALFDEWSARTASLNYDADANRLKWDSWDCSQIENGLTVASIFYAAQQAGYRSSRVRIGSLPPPSATAAPDIPVIHTDDCTTGIDTLRSSLWTASTSDGTATERNRIASVAVCDWLNQRGQFFYHTDLRDFSSAMFFDSHEKILRYVQSDEFLAWLSDAMGINRAETLFKFTSAAVETEALSGKKSRAIIPAEFWHATADAVYLSSGPGRMYRITAQGVDAVDNGTDGVVFSSGSALRPWTLTGPVNPFDVCSLFKNAAYISEHGKLLLALWACTMLTYQRTKPPLCISGTVGSGKTRLAVGLFELLGIPPRVSAITKNGESDFWAQVSCGGLVTFDNADTRNDWLADALAAAATDGGHEKRRLYTDAERVYLRARSWVIITSANPTFAADGGLADRLLVVRLDRLKKETAESSLSDEIAAARDAGLSWMARMIQRALADNTPVPKALNRRHPDHAQMAFRIGRAMGLEREAVAALRAAEADKSSFNLENDPLGSVLLELTEQSEIGLHGTAAELAQEIINFDPYWDGKLSSKSFSRRVAKLWPHLEQHLRAEEYLSAHSKVKMYTFKLPQSA